MYTFGNVTIKMANKTAKNEILLVKSTIKLPENTTANTKMYSLLALPQVNITIHYSNVTQISKTPTHPKQSSTTLLPTELYLDQNVNQK